ncbi:MAG: catalase [Clostridia bacterium]|nr:catalase [Clostridia bacterium]
MHVVKHFLTVCRHRRAVRKLCFKCGLFRQGLAHDLSKFSWAEFWSGAKYYQGNRSPQAREREVSGYSAAWLHHKGRNKHHFEYWTDFADGRRVFVEMPPKYFAEMLCDRIAASKIYLKDKYTDSSPLEYFNAKTDKEGMNPKSCELLEYFLTMLKEKGEKQTLKELKKFVKENK